MGRVATEGVAGTLAEPENAPVAVFSNGSATEMLPAATVVRLMEPVEFGFNTVTKRQNSRDSVSSPPLEKLSLALLTDALRPMTRPPEGTTT